MEDFTKQTATIENFAAAQTEPEEVDFELSEEDRELTNIKTRMLFGDDFSEITTNAEKEAVTDMVAADYNRINKEADVEAISDFIANGDMTTIAEAQAMSGALSTPDVVYTPLEVLAAQLGTKQAIEDGDVSPKYLAARQQLEQATGPYGTPEMMVAKQQVLIRLMSEAKENRSVAGAVSGTVTEFLPFGPQVKGVLASPVSDVGFFESRTGKEAQFVDRIITNPKVSPDEMYTTFKQYEAQFSPETRYAMYERIVSRMSATEQFGFLADLAGILSLGATTVTKGVLGAKLGARAAAILGKTSKAQKAAAAASVGGKAALKTAVIEGVKEIPFATTTMSVATSPVKIAKRLAQRKKYADLLASAVESGAAFESSKVTDAVLADAINTVGSVRIVTEDVQPVANTSAVSAAIEKSGFKKDLLYHINTHAGHIEEMTDSAKRSLEEQAKDLFMAKHPRAKVFGADFEAANVDEVLQPDGTYIFRYTIGTGATGNTPFETLKAAQEAAKNMQIKSNSRIISDRNGFWIQVQTHSNDSAEKFVTDAFEREALEHGAATVKKETGGLLGGFRGTTAKSTGVRRANALMRYEVDTAILPETLKAVASIENLNKQNRALFEGVVEEGRRAEKWVSSEWMRANNYPEPVINAYENYRTLNDIEYVLANKQLIKEKTEQGAKLIEFGFDEKTGLPLTRGVEEEVPLNPNSLSTDVFYFRVNGDEVPTRLTKEELILAAKYGYRMTKSPESYKDIPASVIRNLYDPSRFKAKPLPSQLISYIPGGRRFYSKDNTFIKQLDVFKSERTGRKYVADVITITAGTSIDGARKFASMLEEGRTILRDFRKGFITAEEATSSLQRGLGTVMPVAGNINDFDTWAKTARLNLEPEAVIEAVADNAPLQSYHKIMSDVLAEDIDNVHTRFSRSASSLYTEEQRIRKSHRSGGDLPTLFEDFVPKRMDSAEEMKKIVNDITNAASIKAFDRYYRENFRRVFKEVVNPQVRNEKLLDVTALVKREESNKKAWDNAAMAIRHYKTIKHTPNRFDEVVLEGFDNMLRFFRVSEDIIEGSHDLKALDRLRGMNSYTTFAFAPAQFIKQFGSAAMSKLLMNPREFANSMRLWAAYGLSIDGTPESLKAAGKVLGIAEEELPQIRKFFDNVKAIKSKGKYSEGGILDAGVDMSRAFIKGSMIPYTTGEELDRTLSAMMALLDYGRGWKDNMFRTADVTKLGGAELAEVLNKMNRYYSNMDAAGMAPVQGSKIFQTVFQFKTYQLRWFELMSDTELSAAQKWGFYLASAALYGTIGFGLNNLFSTTENEGLQAVSYGLLDYTVQKLLSEDSYVPAIGEIGSAEALSFIEAGLNIGEAVVNTPIVRFVNSTTQSALRLFRAGQQLFTDPEYTYSAWLEDMKILLTSSDNPFTGVARTSRAAEAFLTGQLRNSSRDLSAKDIGNIDTIMYLLGVNNLRDREMYRAFDANSTGKHDISSIVKELKGPFLNYVEDIYNDSAFVAYKAQHKLYTDGLSPAQVAQVNQELHKLIKSKGKDSYDKLLESIYNRTKATDPRKLLTNTNTGVQ